MVEASLAQISDSMQMYLVTIARLRTNGQPVPLSQLAETLSVSSVSVNEMCHKLQDDGLLVYRPYKGASLTKEGERRAFHILRRHRLWEVFLVDKLGFDYEQAHESACQLEHATPDQVADQLDVFLGYPTVNPQGEPIPRDRLTLRIDRGIPQKDVELIGHLVGCGMLQLARRFVGLLVVEAQLIHQEDLPQPMAAQDVEGSPLALLGERGPLVGAIDEQAIILQLVTHLVDRDR